MKAKSSISNFCLYIISFCFFNLHLSFAALAVAEPNTPSKDSIKIKMLHIFIRADANDVRFDSIWVFENQQRNGPWQISIDLPDKAVVLSFDEPNQFDFKAASGTIHKQMTADSLTGRLDISFVLPNQNGKCYTVLNPGYQVKSAVVSVSGQATQFASDVLKFNSFMVSKVKLPRIYTASDLDEDAKIDINLKFLPRRDGNLTKMLCLVGLTLIFIIALFIIYFNRKNLN